MLEQTNKELLEQISKYILALEHQIDDMNYMNMRFEVIDHTKEKLGRVLSKYNVNVELSVQDDGRTLKVFLTDYKKVNEK